MNLKRTLLVMSLACLSAVAFAEDSNHAYVTTGAAGAAQADQLGFSTRIAYGDRMRIPPNTPIPYGWAVVSGFTSGESLEIKYLLGAPYGATEYLNSIFPIPDGWGRTTAGYATYGNFVNLNGGGRYGDTVLLSNSHRIPANWVKIIQGVSGVDTYRYVVGAPYGAVMWAYTFPLVPNNWVCINSTQGPMMQYMNVAGAPPGTQLLVNVGWGCGIPSGWAYLDNGFPMRRARKL
jgi:hypothetical protein